MNAYDWAQIILTFAALLIASPILGAWMARVFEGERHLLSPTFGWLERLTYRVSGVDVKAEMNWKQYAWALLIFNAFGFAFVFVLQMNQAVLPLNPQHLPNVSWHLAFNTAVSFMSNTNWQSYGGESTMSYLTQMLGLAVQNFLSAGTGIAVMLALVRGFSRTHTDRIGNFWADITRSIVYVLLPLSILFTVTLVQQGVVQNLSGAVAATGLEGGAQTIPMGPAASQVAIKQLGTNGGGYFNVNSAHPFENPTPFSNWLELIAILLLPASLVFAFGNLIKKRSEAKAIFMVMLILLIAAIGVSLWAEFHSPVVMEGKETRFGVTNSVLWSVFTTAASNGSVNAMHSSLSPISGGIAMLGIMLGEIVFGGVGAGLYGMLLFVLLTVFLAGLMVGRTPEYLGKKIEAFDIKMAIVAIVVPSVLILGFAAVACMIPQGLSSLANKGPHGLSEILYAFSSASGNNGSAFAGLNANTPFYNVALGLCMLIGRFVVILPCLAIAGNMAKKKTVPPSPGTFATDTPLFVFLLMSVILILGALTFFPALSLGPVVEHFLMQTHMRF